MHFTPYDPAVTNPEVYQHALAERLAAAGFTVTPPSGATMVSLTGPGAATAAAVTATVAWEDAFTASLMDGAVFVSQDVPQRPTLLGTFLCVGDLGFIYAPRGVGKTWIALLMGGAMGDGNGLGEWDAGNAGPQRVCYVDGEVNLADAIERAVLTELPPNVHWLHHESVADLTGHGINLADPVQQRALLAMLLAKKIQVLFLDNLSCLFRGIAENEADAWEFVLTWLLELRRHGITVILVAHAGRNGEMRGTSRREDSAHWVLKLTDAGDCESKGAEFKSAFTKNRNPRQAALTCPPLLWKLETVGDRLTVSCKTCTEVERLAELVNNGITSGYELAEELGVTKGTISKWARKAAERGLIRIVNREYLPLEKDGRAGE